ncbi:hypothetical protein SAMN06893096_102335 [Geodermatophilus pulveris]|uniref:Uncharacterized protein n=1 Tax=Geodermatophilus pulveris TaxID=1564159 RepID=A0A239CCQ4_9ACTN|nr:hypothetical protein [Geodermatophilus pulveris]SNS17123.1 hypothetical protein SAMN06893096_102335 [Geodermatophilus pulveris]
MHEPRDESGDHGYDTVHADLAAATPPPAGAAPPAEPAGGDGATGGDLGYDEAHDF